MPEWNATFLEGDLVQAVTQLKATEQALLVSARRARQPGTADGRD